jgi:hypothetical protein
MQSRLVSKGNRMSLEIEVDSTAVNRAEVARAMLAAHMLRPGQCEICFISPSTREDDL